MARLSEFPDRPVCRSRVRAAGQGAMQPIAESLPLRGTRLPVSAGTVPDFPWLASLAPARARIRGINLTEA
jgi:hypothetical protein